MKIVSSAILMVSGAYLVLGLAYLRFWMADRTRRDYLAFTLVCFSASIYAWVEVMLMQADTLAEIVFLLRWGHLPAAFAIISVGWFIYVNLDGRKWLFLLVAGTRLLALIINFAVTPNINFRELTAIGQTTILGETLTYPVGEPNPWMILAQISFILLIVYALDACFMLWRRGNLQKALTFGAGAVVFAVVALLLAILVLWGVAEIPLLASVSILPLILSMGYQLNLDLLQLKSVSKKVEDQAAMLKENLNHLNLSASAADVGLWRRRVDSQEIWASEKFLEIFGLPDSRPVTLDEVSAVIHPRDRSRFSSEVSDLVQGAGEYDIEYRVLASDGNVRWVHSRGTIEYSDDSTDIIYGASVDITRRKKAEEAVHELSSKLINAQEKERARLARELHDGLSQNLALLSIQLSELGKAPVNRNQIKHRVELLVREIELLATDVHRISHELHPAKLGQLGLGAALKGLCRELTETYPIDVLCEAENLPRSLPDDLSLCLYRIVQESLQNVVRHSGARHARVALRVESAEVRLNISDDGSGFDTDSRKSEESLGLISMEERVRAQSGALRIESSADGRGTRIEVNIPFELEIR